MDVMDAEVDGDGNTWLDRRIAVDLCEVMLDDDPVNTEDVMIALCGAKHPDATVLLWAIAKGRFGSDSLRMRAINELQSRGELDPKHPITVSL